MCEQRKDTITIQIMTIMVTIMVKPRMEEN